MYVIFIININYLSRLVKKMVAPISKKTFSKLAQLAHAQGRYDVEQANTERGRQQIERDRQELKKYNLWLDKFNQEFAANQSHIQALFVKPVFSRAINRVEYTITVGDLLTDIAGNKLKEAGKDLKLSDVYNGKGIESQTVDITGLKDDEVIAVIEALKILVQEGLIIGHCPAKDNYSDDDYTGEDPRLLNLLLINGFKILDNVDYRKNMKSSDWSRIKFNERKHRLNQTYGNIDISAENSGKSFWELLTPEHSFGKDGLQLADRDIELTWSVTQLGARAYAELLHPPQGGPLVDSSDYL